MRAEVVAMTGENLDMDAIKKAGDILKAGGLVAFPTETVYGLGGNALDPQASMKIYAAKGRPSDNPLIVHIAELEQLEKITTEIPEGAKILAEKYWPGPLTMILPKADIVPRETTGGLDSVAVRFPSDRVAQELIKAGGGFVAAPSANTSGRPSPTMAEHVEEDLGDAIDMIIDGGAVGIGLESTIVDLTSGVPRILRFGHITPQDIERVTGVTPILPENASDTPRVSGSLLAHYAPSTSMAWLDELAPEDRGNSAGLVYSERSEGLGRVMRLPANPHEYARGLYHALRQLDTWGVARIAVERLPDDAAWDAVRDRLNRAIVGSNLPSSADSSNKGIS